MTRMIDPLIDALAKPAIQNGRLKVGKRKNGMPKATLNGPVVIAQPAAGRWRCDDCVTGGKGGKQLLAHSTATGHRVFTDVDYR